ncbi:MAG: OmpA family protein, partial [Albidovulum sp.]
SPQECVVALNAIIARKKITFAPGSAEIEADARVTMEALAEEMRRCPDIAMEIAGHTDSQGREETNLALSQARAEAVLLGLQGRRVLVGALTAKGYGEARPIADNQTEEGREANRRIEFTLVGASAPEATATATQPPADGAGTPPDASGNEAAAPADLPGAEGGQAAAAAAAGAEGVPPTDTETTGTEGSATAPAAGTPEAATDTPFVSSAPAEKTLRPERRPESD